MSIYRKSGQDRPTASGSTGALIRATILNCAVLFGILVCFAGCSAYSNSGDYPATDPPTSPATPVLATISITLPTASIEAGQMVAAIATGLDQFGHPIATDPATFVSSNEIVAGVGPTTGQILGFSVGTTEITATINGKVGRRTVSVVKPLIRINEIMTNGDIPGGFVELINPGNTDVDLGGWTVTGSNIFKSVVLPAGFIIPANGLAVVNEINFPEGLHASDAVHLFSRFGVQVDAYSFLGNPQEDFSRCPQVDGPFVVTVPTRKAANDCENAQTLVSANNASATAKRKL